jgi:XRE family transcriptional regulator, regulator of sulfur utilization
MFNYRRTMEMQEINKKIGQRIQKIRKQKKLTQQELSEKLDCSTTFLSRIERGAITGSLKFFVKIANTLGVPLKAFFDFGEREGQEKVEEIVLRVRDKDNELQDRVLKVVQEK